MRQNDSGALYLVSINPYVLWQDCWHYTYEVEGSFPVQLYMFICLVTLLSRSSPKPPPWAGCSLQTKAGVILLASSSALLSAAAYSVGTCSFPPFPVLSAFLKLYIKYSLLLSHAWFFASQAAPKPSTWLIWQPSAGFHQDVVVLNHFLYSHPRCHYLSRMALLMILLLLFPLVWDLQKYKKQCCHFCGAYP